MEEITIRTTKQREIIDVTETIESAIAKNRLKQGVCVMFVRHTTAALTTGELDPGTDLDMLDAFREMIPKLRYRHAHNPAHVPDHILSSLIGTSLAIPVAQGKLVLGTWQRVVLVEFNGPRDRSILLSFIKNQL